MINFIGNIKAVPVIKKKKMGYITSSYVFYFIFWAFVLIYQLRRNDAYTEGAAENQFIQTKLFLTVFIDGIIKEK
jgi:hypothetical protein